MNNQVNVRSTQAFIDAPESSAVPVIVEIAETGPRGAKGDTGATPHITIGEVVVDPVPFVSITGTAANPIFNFGIPKGETGLTPQIKIGTVKADRNPSVSITGTAENPTFDFTFPILDKDEMLSAFDEKIEAATIAADASQAAAISSTMASAAALSSQENAMAAQRAAETAQEAAEKAQKIVEKSETATVQSAAQAQTSAQQAQDAADRAAYLVTPVTGHFALSVRSDGHLIATYADGDEPPLLRIDENGDLIMTVGGVESVGT